MSDCIFCRIVQNEIPADKIYEDQDILVFRDIKPAFPIHLLMIPKRHIASLFDIHSADEALLGKMLALVPKIAAGQGMTDGFKTGINTGRGGGQEVFHLHIHIMGNKNK